MYKRFNGLGNYTGFEVNFCMYVLVPPDMCLLGCVFLIVEYDRLLGSEVTTWTRVIIENGGEIELNYSSRLTHIICITQKHPLVYQVFFSVYCY